MADNDLSYSQLVRQAALELLRAAGASFVSEDIEDRLHAKVLSQDLLYSSEDDSVTVTMRIKCRREPFE